MYELSPDDKYCFEEAILQANQAEAEGNLPIGAVVFLEGEIISSGRNAIWSPRFEPYRHAEIEAIRRVPGDLWSKSMKMTIYSTLEPCLMCFSAILLHRFGRVLYGSADEYGGASRAIGHTPPYFEERLAEISWIGPVYPDACDALYQRVMQQVDNQSSRNA